MKKFLKVLVIIVIIGAIVYFAPKLVHKCDSCEELIIGAGYEANIIADTVADDDQTICKDCAEKQHIVEITLGKSVDDYRKKLFD